MNWLAAVAVALWPVWAWSVERFLDGSDEPWGVAAIAALAVLVWRDREAWRTAPRPAWLVAAAALACAAVVSEPLLPPLLRGVLASFAIVATLAAIRSPRHPMLPLLVLALLSLPILSSLQFYLGYPLRVVTAEASAWILRGAGLAAARSGSALTVDGTLVIVDAPCAGLHMAWAAWFTAAVAAAWQRLDTRAFVVRLPIVGVLVLGANVLRNTVLVALESRAGGPMPADANALWHDGTGLAAFTLIAGVILWHMQRPVQAR